jgi:predicted nucleotidyltransferase
MNTIITDHLSEIHMLCRKYHVTSLHVFGSATGDRFTEESDVDFLVSFESMDSGDLLDSFLALADQLEQTIDRKIDLITENMLGNPYFIESVERSKELIYEREHSEIPQ